MAYKIYGIFTVLALLPWPSYAQVISPNATELKFTYEVQFISKDKYGDAMEKAENHALHLFGALQSPELAKQYGINKIEGIGVPRASQNIKILEDTYNSNYQRVISYQNSALILMQKNAAKAAIKKGYFDLVLPLTIEDIYDDKCTDSHYKGLEDYWYFWNPYRKGCTYLQKSPFGQKVRVFVRQAFTRQLDSNPRFDLLRGPNGNGDLFKIDIVYGFNESTSKKTDEGRLGFKELGAFLNSQKFIKSQSFKSESGEFAQFQKTIGLVNGKKIDVVIDTLLTDTGIGALSTEFPKFFKNAVEHSDVFIYAGHSGLGGNLDIPSLEQRVGRYRFNPDKRQIYMFESCASYSYYLEPFREQKTRPRLDIITNGLSSYYEDGSKTIIAFLKQLLDPETQAKDWNSILESMEKPLKGYSYLLNVGGV